jgi:hypothetical protein
MLLLLLLLLLQETEDNATLEEIQSIQLTRAKLEQWHNEVRTPATLHPKRAATCGTLQAAVACVA